jgi:hypothetical protein
MDMPGGAGFGGPAYYGAPLKAAVQAGQVPVPVLSSLRSVVGSPHRGVYGVPPRIGQLAQMRGRGPLSVILG